jgi:hypothetical protein
LRARGVERFIIRENIKRFKKQLARCSDPAKRSTLEKLLAAEEAHLNKLGIGGAGRQRGSKPK